MQRVRGRRFLETGRAPTSPATAKELQLLAPLACSNTHRDIPWNLDLTTHLEEHF
ncbi:hypothetical protein CSPX01_09996 [Colletotrichum filicis]|nr:hypothetical protein CSPX01_09996 [Colletotrichum filicis]